ncbi:hypothetical protein Asi03nite_09820 [Actinoplanes siamensis]|uniref:Uncharacterized protein n=2 Tax=Actinoplanes siamensis TaxID=1223317 RepID=A0A919KD30_9ACTN|nr:hypothetical protein Asi03nite_09820 [Actinoplanes siamensis]
MFADPPGTRRPRRDVRIREAPPGTDLFATAGDVWRRGGCQVDDTYTGSGRTVVAHDPAGYVLVLTESAGAAAVLSVLGPPTSRRDPRLILGVVTGAVLGPVATCASFLFALDRSAFSERWPASGAWLMWIWLPLLLAVGGLLLASASTRRFGTGLLIGCAATGIATSGICTAMLR